MRNLVIAVNLITVNKSFKSIKHNYLFKNDQYKKCLELIIQEMELNYQSEQINFSKSKEEKRQKLRKLRRLRKFNFTIADFCKDLIYTKTVKMTKQDKTEWKELVKTWYKRIKKMSFRYQILIPKYLDCTLKNYIKET